MDWVMLGIVLVLVFTVGFVFAPLGLGGGMLFVPILHYIAAVSYTHLTLPTNREV